MVAALNMVWLIEKAGLILIYRQPLRVLESKWFCPKSWRNVTREVQISLDAGMPSMEKYSCGKLNF